MILSKYAVPLAITLILSPGCTRYTGPSDDEGNQPIEVVAVYATPFDVSMNRELGFPNLKRILDSYEEEIRRSARRYGFDWRFILAVMNQESRFQTRAVSPRGAYGLMQIMPATGRDITTRLIIDDVRAPENNIMGGIYYLWWVYNLFDPELEGGGMTANETDRLRLALAAYNGGPTRVRDAQTIARYLRLDPYRWENIGVLLTMLTERYYSLHQYVWAEGKPEGGYFYGWSETIPYVESVVEYYSYYLYIFD